MVLITSPFYLLYATKAVSRETWIAPGGVQTQYPQCHQGYDAGVAHAANLNCILKGKISEEHGGLTLSNCLEGNSVMKTRHSPTTYL